MVIGKPGGVRQLEFWVPKRNLTRGPGHIFDDNLKQLLTEAGFELFFEQLCETCDGVGWRPSIPPGVYFVRCDKEYRPQGYVHFCYAILTLYVGKVAEATPPTYDLCRA